jgi:hypothetical protein
MSNMFFFYGGLVLCLCLFIFMFYFLIDMADLLIAMVEVSGLEAFHHRA